MAREGLVEIIIASEAVLILSLMAFNAYFLSRRPIMHYIREIYFVNSARFREAWYLVISATTFFLLQELVEVLGAAGRFLNASEAAQYAQIFTLCFTSLISVAFAIVFLVFIKYVRKLPAPESEVSDLIAADMRRSVMRHDRELNVELDLSQVGDVVTQRRQLGPTVSLSHYRAITTGFVAYMEHRLGHMGDAILYAVGRLTGHRATQEILRDNPNKERALGQILTEIRENGIAIPEIRQTTADRVDVVLLENAPAAGIKPLGKPICHYQAGMLAGIYEALTGKPTLAKESKCWGLGDRLCEFRIDLRTE